MGRGRGGRARDNKDRPLSQPPWKGQRGGGEKEIRYEVDYYKSPYALLITHPHTHSSNGIAEEGGWERKPEQGMKTMAIRRRHLHFCLWFIRHRHMRVWLLQKRLVNLHFHHVIYDPYDIQGVFTEEEDRGGPPPVFFLHVSHDVPEPITAAGIINCFSWRSENGKVDQDSNKIV